MNKTETLLLARINTHGHGALESGGGRGPDGGRISFGTRERNALMALVERGIVEITDRSKSVEYNKGNSVHSTLFTYKLKA